MASWTKQKGFPLISVSQRQDGDSRILKLTQSKFTADGKVPESEKDTTWMVPLTVITSSSPKTPVLTTVLSSASSEFVLPNVTASEWVKLNQDSVGVFRVQYSPEMLHDLLPAVESKTLQPIDRLTLHTDLFALVRAGKNSTVEVLRLLEAYKEEEEYSVWSGISSALSQISLILDYTDFKESYNVWGRRLLAPLFAKVGWQPKAEGEKHTDALLRALTLGRLAAYGEPTVLEEARKRFDAHVKGTQVSLERVVAVSPDHSVCLLFSLILR